MQPIQTQQVPQQVQYPLGKKPALTEKQMKNLRMVLQSITLPQQNNTYYYNIVQKQSTTGLFDNQRLLFLNLQTKAISYLSKIPHGFLPYSNYDEIASNKVKQKVMMNQVEGFKCTPLKGKISSMVVEWVDKDKKQKKWTFILGSSKLMNDWVALVNCVKDGTYDKEKYEQMNKLNQLSPLTSNKPLTPQKNSAVLDQPLTGQNNNNSQLTNPQNNNNPQNVAPSSQLGYGNQKPNQENPNPQTNNPPLGYNNQTNNQPLPLGASNTSGYQGLGNTPSSNLNNNNQLPLNNNNPNPINNTTAPYNSTKPPLNSNTTPINNTRTPSNNYISPSNNANRLTSPTNQQYLPNSTLNNPPSNTSNTYKQPNTTQNLPTFQNPQKPKQPTLNNYSSPTYQNQPNLANSILIPASQSQMTPQSAYMQGGELEMSRKPKIAKMGQSVMNPSNVPPPQTFVNYNTSTPMSDGSHLPNQPSSHAGHAPKQQTFSPLSRNNELAPPPPTQQSRPLTHNPSEPPGDFVEQLKRKRQKNPEMFILNNQLSRKNLNDYNTPPYEELNNPGYYNTNQSHPNQSISPHNQRIEPMQRMASQNQMNREPSQKNIQPNDRQSMYGSKESEHRPIPRQNTNQKMQQLVREPSARQFNKDPSKSQFSRNLPINDGYSRPEIQPHITQVDDYQGYKPTTSYPQSTKNLNKIRSDYLQRKASNVGSFSNLPNSTKNQHNRLMQNNYMAQPSQHNSKKPSQPYSRKHNEQSHEKLPKFDSSQSRRQDSMNNLNKVASSYLSNKQKNYPSYNDVWLETSNPNKKLEVHDQFMTRSRELVCQIVDQIPLPKSQRQFQPVQSDDKQNLYTFIVENMIIKLHFFTQQQSINDSSDNINEDAPVLYSHTTYHELKRQFYNYNLILSLTSNQARIKVPLCCCVEYRGILAIVKADVPSSYKQVEPYTYSDQFEALENMIKVRFMFGTFNCYESQGVRGAESRFVVLWNLRNLIPGVPGISGGYFRKELLMQYDEILEDLETSSQAHAFTIRHILPQFIAKLQSLEIHVLSSTDLVRQCHRVGLSLSYLPQMYKQTNSHYLKKLFLSQIVSQIFAQVVRSQLNHAFAILPAENMQNSSPQELNQVVVACAHVLINEFFSYTQRSQSIWRLIVNQASKRYRMIVSKEDVIGGYLLSGIVSKLSIECDFKQKTFLKQKKFFVHENIIPRQTFIAFTPKCRQYDMQAICPAYSKCKQIVESQETNMDTYEQLSMILNLRTRTTQLPEYYRPLIEELKTYIANYIPYTSEHEYEHLDVYEFMYEEPITYNGTKTAFLAIKWLIKANQVEKANQLFEIKFHELSYWLSEYNTSITEFYDFFSMYYASIGDYDESICLAKSSLINMTKVLGPGALPVADKHYQLGNIYFKINRKNQALKQYNKTKQILINHDKTTIPEYGIILLKIALLCLNFGQLTECLSNAIEAERIFQNNGGNEHEEIECFEILSRVYEITRKQQDISSLCEACSKTFNMSENPKIVQRMLKIVLYPKLTNLSSQQQKSLLPLLTRLSQHTLTPSSYLDSFNFLHRMASKGLNLKRKLYYYLENAVILGEQINRRDLLRKHTSYSEKTSGQAEDMLVVVEAVGNMVGWSFLIGSLKDGGYYD